MMDSSAAANLKTQQESLSVLSARITQEEHSLASLVEERIRSISALKQEHALLDLALLRTRADLAPIRRLPRELLRDIFVKSWQDQPTISWVLAFVSRGWRELALSIPLIWSKINLTTSPNHSPDTIRLWLSRSGSVIPLDIEIHLKTPTQLAITPFSLPRAAHNASLMGKSAHWGYVAVFYLVEQMHRWERFVFRFERQFSSLYALRSILGNAPLLREFEITCAWPSLYPFTDWPYLPCSQIPYTLPSLTSVSLSNTPFLSTSPLLIGPAPPHSSRLSLTHLTLLAHPAMHIPLDRIFSLLRANPSLEVCRLNFTLVSDPVLPLFPSSAPLCLPDLHHLSLRGSVSLISLLSAIKCPALSTFDLDIDCRESIEEELVDFLLRSGPPALSDLSLAYRYPSELTGIQSGPPVPVPLGGGIGLGVGVTLGNVSVAVGGAPAIAILGGGGGGAGGGGVGNNGMMIRSWVWLGNPQAGLQDLQVLRVGGCSLDGVLWALQQRTFAVAPSPALPGLGRLVLPKLEKLCLCGGGMALAHAEGRAILVGMVEARNPGHGQGAGQGQSQAVGRLKELEMVQCAPLGADVLQWLEGKIAKVRVLGER